MEGSAWFQNKLNIHLLETYRFLWSRHAEESTGMGEESAGANFYLLFGGLFSLLQSLMHMVYFKRTSFLPYSISISISLNFPWNLAHDLPLSL